MNGVWWHEDTVEQLGWALLHSLWQGGLAAVLCAVTRVVLRRQSAQARYVAACVLLFALAAAPVITFCASPPPAPWTGPRGVPDTRHTEPAAGVGTFSADAAFLISGAGPNLVTEASELLERCLPWLVLAWLLGVAITGARWFHGCCWVRRIRRTDIQPLENAWLHRLRELQCRLRVSRPVRLVKSALVEVPMVVGWLRPVILLPASSLSGLTPAQLEAILAHELAHVRRYDYLVNVFQNLIETLMFYHPAVWWISRNIREDREHCCDDLVMRVCRDRMIYARALFRLEEMRGLPGRLALPASGAPLLQRIRRLMGGAPEHWPVGPKEFGGLGLVALGSVLILTGLCLMLEFPVYRSVARVRIEPPTPWTTSHPSGNWPSSYDPYLLQTEIGVICSPPVLQQAADSLKLGEAWTQRSHSLAKLTEPEVLARLRKCVSVRPVRNTMLLEVQALDDNPAESAAIANAVVKAYQQYRQEQALRSANVRSVALKQLMALEDKKTAQAREHVEALRAELNIPPSLDANDDAPTVQMTGEMLRRLESLRIEYQAEYTRQKTLLEQLKQMKPDDLPQALPTAVGDPMLTSLLEQSSLAEERLSGLKIEFGPENTEVRKASSQLKDLREKIVARTQGIMLGLQAKVESMKMSIDQLQYQSNDYHARTAKKAAQNSVQYRPYWEALRELRVSEGFHQALMVKLAAEETDSQLSKPQMIEIIETATAPARSVVPNRPLAGAMTLGGLLLALTGMFIVRAGRSLAPTARA